MEHSSILDGECMITGAQPDPLKHYIFSVLHLLTSHIFFVVYYAARSPGRLKMEDHTGSAFQ